MTFICFNEEQEIIGIKSVVIGIILIIGTMISYIPQYIVIVRNKSSEGLNFFTIGLGLFTGLLTLINHGILQWTSIICCGFLEVNQCLASQLSTGQLFIGPASLFVEYMLFLWFFENDKDEESERNFKISTYFFAGLLGTTLFFSMMGFFMYFVLHMAAEIVMGYAKILGFVSSFLTLIQWLPQIYTTWRLQDIGSLSLPMLLIQAPGSFLVVFFQISVGSDLTTWFPYVITFLSQLILVSMCLYFMFIFKWKGQKESLQLLDKPEKEENDIEIHDEDL